MALYTNYWVNFEMPEAINEGTMTRAAALIGFAESPENISLVTLQIEDGIWLTI